MDAIAQDIASHFPANNLDRERDNYFVSAPFTFDRHQLDSKVDVNVNPKFNLAGTFGVLHYRTSVPTVFGDDAVGEPIGGSSNPGSGHGNTYRFTVMGTYIFTPTFLMDAHFGWAKQGTNSEQPGLGTNIGSDVLGIPGTNGPRAFESGWPTFQFVEGDDDGDFATIGVNENFMPYYRHDPQTQYVVNFNWLKNKHNVRFGADIYHMALNQAQAEFITGGFGAQGGFGFDRGITERCEVVDPATGNCEQTSDSSRYNSVAGFLIGQAARAGRTLQVPDEYHVRARLYSLYARDRWTIGDNLTLDFGTRWEYFPVPTRPDRGIERYDVETGKVLLCGVGDIPKDCGIKASKTRFGPRVGLAYRIGDKWVARAGYGLTNDPYEALELIRANYPILIQVKRESPDGLTPAATLSGGIPAIQVPAEGNGVLDIPSDYAFGGYPKDLDRGYIESWNLTVQRELPWKMTGQIGYVATHTVRQLGLVDINAGQAIGAGDDGKPLEALYGRTASTVFLQPVGNGNYHSLQAQLARRFADGLSLGVGYTWSKAHEPQREQLRNAESPGAGVHEPQLRAHQLQSHAQRRHYQRLGASVRPGAALAEREGSGFLYSRRLADQQHRQHHERRAVQCLRRRHLAELAGQHPDGRPGEAGRGETWRKGSRKPLLRSFCLRRGDRSAIRQQRLLLAARARPVQLGLRVDPRVLHHLGRQAAVPHGGVQLHQHAPPRHPRQRRRRRRGFHDDHGRDESRPGRHRRAAVPAGFPRRLLSGRDAVRSRRMRREYCAALAILLACDRRPAPRGGRRPGRRSRAIGPRGVHTRRVTAIGPALYR